MNLLWKQLLCLHVWYEAIPRNITEITMEHNHWIIWHCYKCDKRYIEKEPFDRPMDLEKE